MPKRKSNKPEFYDSLIKEGTFPQANKIIKYQESDNYWIFKTGKKVLKVKKKEAQSTAIPMEELFCREIVEQMQIHSPLAEAKLVCVKKDGDSFSIDWDHQSSSKENYCAVYMNQLSDRGFLSNMISKNKLAEKSLERISLHLYEFHQKTPVSKSKEDGSPDLVWEKIENLYYQSKKYLNQTITKAIIDMTLRPIEKYLNDNRKLFLRRMKGGEIKLVHGCLIPRKIHCTKEDVTFLGKTSDPLKDRFRDVASDIADLSVELLISDLEQMSETFINSYVQQSGDKDIPLVLPIYQAARCLSLGLKHSIKSVSESSKQAEEDKQQAIRYYEQTIDVVRAL